MSFNSTFKTPGKPISRGKGFKSKLPPKREAKQSSHVPKRTSECRMYDGKDRATVQVPKDAPVRHEGYRRLVAAMPCIACNYPAPSQCAHGPSLGRGIKSCDLGSFPLCATRPGEEGCHVKFDQYRMHGKDVRADVARLWAERTRVAIRDSGKWPRDLPWRD